MSRHLMARFAHLRTAADAPKSEFPWRPEDREWTHGEHGPYRPDTEAWHAPLENGHRLIVWDDSITEPRWGPLDDGGFRMGDLPPEEPGSHWKGGYDLGVDSPDYHDPDVYEAAGYPADWGVDFQAVFDPRSKLRAKAYPTREKAIQAVERHYRRKYPIGTPSQSGPADSGVDYGEALKSTLPPLDDDYGDIFGDR